MRPICSAMELSCAAPCPSQITLPIVPRTRTAVDWPIHVLLVEDNPEAAWLVQLCLTGNEEGQFTLEWSPSLLQAMTRLSEPGVEVVLLDLGMPELNGYRSFRAIEATSDSKVPIVILTSDDSTASRSMTLGFGASDYLIKDDISPDRLRLALKDAIRRGRPH
jgi:DNA-binding response OmpR family regulator